MESSQFSEVRWLPAAQLLRPQGRRGEILAEPLTDREGVFEPGRHFQAYRQASQSALLHLQLQEVWRPQGKQAGRLVLKLAGVDSISAAEALQGWELRVNEADLPPLAPDTFLVSDLLGCTLFDGDRPVGSVSDLQFPIGADGRTRLPDTADLLAVQPEGAAPDAEPVLVPFVKAWLLEVDLPGRRIRMQLPIGLLE